MATWRDLIQEEMDMADEGWDDVVAVAPPDLDFDREFDEGFGSAEGEPFTLWTRNRVYFPTEYDGSETVASVPRNPCDEVTTHV